jgi:hypothetical protein
MKGAILFRTAQVFGSVIWACTSMKSGQMTGFVAPYVQLMQGASPGPVIISAFSLIKLRNL